MFGGYTNKLGLKRTKVLAVHIKTDQTTLSLSLVVSLERETKTFDVYTRVYIHLIFQ